MAFSITNQLLYQFSCRSNAALLGACFGTVTLYCHTFDICMGLHGPVWGRNTRCAKVPKGSIRLDTVGVTGSNPVSRTISHLCAPRTIYAFPSESQRRDRNPARLGSELANVLMPPSHIGTIPDGRI